MFSLYTAASHTAHVLYMFCVYALLVVIYYFMNICYFREKHSHLQNVGECCNAQ